MSDYQYSKLELKLRAECEQGFKIGPRAHTAISETGETFTVLTNPELKFVSSEDQIYRLALETFRNYAIGKTGMIYWRIYPEIAFAPRNLTREFQGSGYKFYMRVLISNEPRAADALASRQDVM